MFCPNCGTKCIDGYKYCMHCGTKLSDETVIEMMSPSAAGQINQRMREYQPEPEVVRPQVNSFYNNMPQEAAHSKEVVDDDTFENDLSVLVSKPGKNTLAGMIGFLVIFAVCWIYLAMF